MKLSIIIVNYKTPQLVLDCIGSVYRFGTEGMEILVVDNDSGDDMESLLQQKFPEVIFLQMGYNSGFARANNAAIKIAKGESVLLLNSDTIVEDDAINSSLQKFTASSFVACGVQLLNLDRTPQISGNFAMKGGLNYLLPLPYTGIVLKFIAGQLKVKKPNVPEASGVVEVDWINGAYLMVKKTAIDKAGLLDEDFFLYAEEAEWCSRLKKNGPLCIYGDDHVVHLQGQSANDAFQSAGAGYFNLFDKKGFQIMLSNLLRIRKQWGTGWFIFDLLVYFLTIPVFFLGWGFSKMIYGNRSKYSFKQWKGFTRNVFAMIGYAPKVISNKPWFYKVL